MKKEEKERKKAEFRQKVFQEVLRREWLKFYIHQHQLHKKAEKTQKKQEKKQRRLNELELQHKRYHEQLPAWMFEQGGL
jgi:hypothetical protein